MKISPEVYTSDNVVAEPATHALSQKQAGEGKTLLIVDDEAGIRELMAQVLCHEGYNVLQADGATEALRLATAANIHLLLTDFSMPGMDGLELTRQFRAVYPKAPVLIVSGSLVGLHSRVEDLHQFCLLEKPFALEELVGKVRALLAEASPLPKPTH